MENAKQINEISIFVDRDDVKAVTEEERINFIRGVLEAIGLPDLEKNWPEDAEFNAERKLRLREYLNPFELDIVEDVDGTTKIYAKDDVIAEWLIPKYMLRTDPKAKRRSQMVYFELIIRFWSMFDFEEEQENDK